LASITEICQSTGLTITRAFGYLTTLIQGYRLHIRHEDAHECSTDKNFKDAAALHGGTSGWRYLRKQQITDRISINLAEIQHVIPQTSPLLAQEKLLGTSPRLDNFGHNYNVVCMCYIQYKCSVTIILVAIIYSIHFILVNCIALILLSESAMLKDAVSS
jgi:hypothetical protein